MAVRVRSMPFVGPPVMTGSPSGVLPGRGPVDDRREERVRVGLVDGGGVDEDGEVDRDARRAVDHLLADDGSGIRRRSGVDDRHDRDRGRRQGDLFAVGQRPGDRRGRGGDRHDRHAGEEHDGDRSERGSSQTGSSGRHVATSAASVGAHPPPPRHARSLAGWLRLAHADAMDGRGRAARTRYDIGPCIGDRTP